VPVAVVEIGPLQPRSVRPSSKVGRRALSWRRRDRLAGYSHRLSRRCASTSKGRRWSPA